MLLKIILLFLLSGSRSNGQEPSESPASSNCEVPESLENGEYAVDPDEPTVIVTICHKGYKVDGKRFIRCVDGKWRHPLPKCVPENPSQMPGGTVLGASAQPPSSERDTCVVPAFPTGVSFTVNGNPFVQPGREADTIRLNVTCDPGYILQGSQEVFCVKGRWSASLPTCVKNRCRLSKVQGVDYFCTVSENNGVILYKQCGEYLPVGTVVSPECKSDYTHKGIIKKMTCLETSQWDRIITCKTEKISPGCGETHLNSALISGGTDAAIGEIPWHVGIYSKATNPYMQICGGTLVTNTLVISAAHCFSSDYERQPAQAFAVAAGKIYRPWNNPYDIHAQRSDVEQIYIPAKYLGNTANYQEDIAVLKLTNSIDNTRYVVPACLDFDPELDAKQLKDNVKGKVAGWGLRNEHGLDAPILQTAELPVINSKRCLDETSPSYKPYITTDKICAGYKNGTAVCKGDSGGGLAFPSEIGGVQRYFLRGIVSNSPKDGNQCNIYTWATFTHLRTHQDFIKLYL